MNPFTYERPQTKEEILRLLSQRTKAKLIGGGTNLLDLMKENIEAPEVLIDINKSYLNEIRFTSDGGLSIGAGVTNAAAAYHPDVQRLYPLLSDAILAGASPQLRNMATCGGNLLQRTRCYYFYDKATACNKRDPGAGCDAIRGINRIHAVLGASASCIATHPSDMCVALAALNARVRVAGAVGERTIPFQEFHRLPGDKPDVETTLAKDELIVSIELPKETFSLNYSYLKVRDRSSYAFALVSAAVALSLKDGRIEDARIAMGGVAHKPWRDIAAEESLRGAAPTRDAFQSFAVAVFKDARGYEHNTFKIEMGQRVLVRALEDALRKNDQTGLH